MASTYWGIGEIHDRDKTIILRFKSGVLGVADQENGYSYRIEKPQQSSKCYISKLASYSVKKRQTKGAIEEIYNLNFKQYWMIESFTFVFTDENTKVQSDKVADNQNIWQ